MLTDAQKRLIAKAEAAAPTTHPSACRGGLDQWCGQARGQDCYHEPR